MFATLDYIYFRIGYYYKYYRSLLTGKKAECGHPYITASYYLGLSIAMNLVSFIVLFFRNLIVDDEKLVLATFVLGFIISFLYRDEDKFKELEIKYKDEKYKTLKGCLVAAYIVGSFILFVYATSKTS